MEYAEFITYSNCVTTYCLILLTITLPISALFIITTLVDKKIAMSFIKNTWILNEEE